MPFFLDGNPTQSEIAEAVNYLLGNVLQSTATNIITGQVTDATGNIVSYLYKYLNVKYADSFDGTLNFSDVPTNRAYYGLRNNDSSIESTNPADYVWYQVAGGFSTTKFIWYSVTGGRRINIVVSTSSPSIFYQIDTGIAINLDQISAADGASSRICYAKSASFALASTPTTYQTSGPSGFPPYNTWGGSETWQATPPMLGTNEALFQSDGIYNPSSDLTTWNVPYLSNLKVGTLSAISADLGTITAGSMNAVNITGSDLTIGSSPAISGTTMTGSGSHLYNTGNFAFGNATTNMVFNGTNMYLNGFQQLSAVSSSGGLIGTGSANVDLLTFTVDAAGANKSILILTCGSFFAGNPYSGGYLYTGTTWFATENSFYIKNNGTGSTIYSQYYYIPFPAISLTSGERTGAAAVTYATIITPPAGSYTVGLTVNSLCKDNTSATLGSAESYYENVRTLAYISQI